MLESASSIRRRLDYSLKPTANAPLVCSQSFPHLWKKLWKFITICASAQLFFRFLGVFCEGEARKSRQIWISGQSIRIRGLKIDHLMWRKLTEAGFC